MTVGLSPGAAFTQQKVQLVMVNEVHSRHSLMEYILIECASTACLELLVSLIDTA